MAQSGDKGAFEVDVLFSFHLKAGQHVDAEIDSESHENDDKKNGDDVQCTDQEPNDKESPGHAHGQG